MIINYADLEDANLRIAEQSIKNSKVWVSLIKSSFN